MARSIGSHAGSPHPKRVRCLVFCLNLIIKAGHAWTDVTKKDVRHIGVKDDKW